MIKYLLIVSLIGLAYSQSIDKNFCDIDAIVEDPDKIPLPTIPLDAVYETEVEQNADDTTDEIKEFYNGLANMARSRSIVAGININQYVYPETNEFLLVEGTQCTRYDLTNDDSILDSSSFMLVQAAGHKRVVSSTFGYLFAQRQYVDFGLQVKYVGKDKRRGIPARKWVACLFNKANVETTKVSLYYSDPNLWTPAHTVTNKTVPLQIEFARKKGSDVKYEVNNILQYTEKTVIREEDLYTETGVYCAGRTSAKQIPTINRQFSTDMQISIPKPDQFQMAGDVSVMKGEFDFDRNLFSLRYYVKDHPIKEVHDWNSGLKYTADMTDRLCQVSKLLPNDTVSLPHLFRLDEEPKFQFIGQTRVRGINTNVFTAPRIYQGVETVWEYHFASELWQIQDGRNITQETPILLTIAKTFSDPSKPSEYKYIHYLSWETTKSDLFDFDISQCQIQQAVLNNHIRFEIKPQVPDYENLKAHQKDFKARLTESLIQAMDVNLPRIGGVDTVYHNKTIFVTFTLFDKPNYYGKDNVIENDLNTAQQKLNQSILNDAFSVIYNNIRFKPEKNSYILLEKRDGRFVYEITESGETINYSLGSVIAFLIVFLLAGMGVGFAVGYFFIIKRSGALPELPGPLGFLNPGFSEQSKA